MSPTIAGCDRHYGSANVCVPTNFPPEVANTTKARCTWLKTHDYGRLKVNGKDDPLGLDPRRKRQGLLALSSPSGLSSARPAFEDSLLKPAAALREGAGRGRIPHPPQPTRTGPPPAPTTSAPA